MQHSTVMLDWESPICLMVTLYEPLPCEFYNTHPSKLSYSFEAWNGRLYHVCRSLLAGSWSCAPCIFYKMCISTEMLKKKIKLWKFIFYKLSHTTSSTNNNTKVFPSSKFTFWNDPLNLTSIAALLPVTHVNQVVLQTLTDWVVFLVFMLNIYNLKHNFLPLIVSITDTCILWSLVSILDSCIFPQLILIHHDYS